MRMQTLPTLQPRLPAAPTLITAPMSITASMSINARTPFLLSSRNGMRPMSAMSAVAVSAALLLAACGKDYASPPKPLTKAAPSAPATPATMGAAGDASVPAAGAVFSTTEDSPKAEAAAAAATGATTAAATTRSNRTMSRAEESAAMPMAGQANDHSAPAAASAPSRVKP